MELEPLIFSKKINVTGIEIQEPEIDLVQSDAGIWNFASLGAKSPANPPRRLPVAGRRVIAVDARFDRQAGKDY